jgi:DMSO/TMAO reductase YedYZ molybdopterin-dependent catalytic subunit
MSSVKLPPKKLPPGQTPIPRILKWGTDHPGVAELNPKIDLKTYTLAIDGEVEQPKALTWQEILSLPATVSTFDFHCVEGWSVNDCTWEGVLFDEIITLVKPRLSAKYVTFECADGYATSLTRDELVSNKALLAYKLDGKPLEEGLGFPLRLVVPNKYAYKSAMWLIHMHFSSVKTLGFWEKRGYSDTADVWRNDRFSR